MSDVPKLERYYLHEREWESYEELRETFEHDVPDQFNMAARVCDWWADDRGRVAFFADGEDRQRSTLTFRDLQHEANRLANYLAEQGVGRGDRVGVNTPQKPETVVAHVAIWKLGAVSVPLSTLFGPDAVQYRLDDCDAVACVVDAENVDAFRTARANLDALDTVVTTGAAEPTDDETAWDAAIAGESRDRQTVTTGADEDAMMVYTSGTTGQPKGVLHGHRVLLGYLPGVLSVIFDMEVRDDDVVWAMPEWAWVGTLFAQVLPAMFYGMPQLAYHSDGPFDAEQTFEVLEEHEVTLTFLPPTALRMMKQVPEPGTRYDVDSVRIVMSGGESVGQDVVDWVETTFSGGVVHEVYGQTEHNPLVGTCTSLFEFREGKMGLPVLDKDVAIVDPETAEPLDPGEVGEIAVRYENDPSHFKEYWNKPEKTARKRKNGWHLTEDLGVMDEDGYVAFRGRKDDVIMCAGHRIGPEEIEESLARHGAVADAGVIGAPDETRGEVPVAYVVLAEGYDRSEELARELQQFVKDHLAQYEYPRDIVFIDELPMTATGKIQRYELAERYRESAES